MRGMKRPARQETQAQAIARLKLTVQPDCLFRDQEFMAEGESRFGSDFERWRFVCPHCGYVATVIEWKQAGAGIESVGRSCVGNWKSVDALSASGPCTYKGDDRNPCFVVFADGVVRRVFAYADV